MATCQTALNEIGERNVFVRHQAWLGCSTIALAWDRLDEAADYLERSRETQHPSGRIYRVITAVTLLQSARILRARGQLEAAGEVLEQAEAAARQQGSTRAERLVRAERAWLALLDGRAVDAERWADVLDPTGLETYAREPEALVLARVRRAQGSGGELVPLLEGLLSAAARAGRQDSTIPLLVQLALIGEPDERGALTTLKRAVTLAEPEGYARVFLDEGEPMVALLRELLRGGVSPAYVAGLLQSFGSERTRPTHMAELLTPREREVLRLLARGLSNRAIAERLVTSHATIKSHVHHLIGKLGVASRAEVLVRARELGELATMTHPRGTR